MPALHSIFPLSIPFFILSFFFGGRGHWYRKYQCTIGWPWTHCVAQTGLRFAVPLPQTPKHYGDRHVSPYLAHSLILSSSLPCPYFLSSLLTYIILFERWTSIVLYPSSFLFQLTYDTAWKILNSKNFEFPLFCFSKVLSLPPRLYYLSDNHPAVVKNEVLPRALPSSVGRAISWVSPVPPPCIFPLNSSGFPCSRLPVSHLRVQVSPCEA